MINSQEKEYLKRINIVCDYIEKNVTKSFTLDELSQISGFSKYHFHRIFTSFMKETLYNYITRQKMERAAAILMFYPDKSITEIALDYGFADSAMFARSFKKHYGINATEYRQKYSKISKIESKNSKEDFKLPKYNQNENTNYRRLNKMDIRSNVEMVTIDEMSVAYLRHVGTYEEFGKVFGSMVARIMAWGGAQGLINTDTKLIAIYHDNPNITESEKLRTSICITIPKDTEVENDMGKMAIAGGMYAIGHFEIDDKKAAEQHSRAWQYLYGQWLPQSGYEPDDKPVFEVYVNDPNTHPERKHFIDIYLPVKSLK